MKPAPENIPFLEAFAESYSKPTFACVRIGQFMIEDGSELVEEIASVLNEVEPV